MGGNNAWKKRVAMGGLMKGSGGAALRHHPHLGRKGKEELKLNRLGNIGGRPNPKNKIQRKKLQKPQFQKHSTKITEHVVINNNQISNTPIIYKNNNDNNNSTTKSTCDDEKKTTIEAGSNKKSNMTKSRLLWKYRSIGFGCIVFLVIFVLQYVSSKQL
jgi:hypothetical protein